MSLDQDNMIPLKLSKPIFEHHYDGIGVGQSKPRISWSFLTSEPSDVSLNWTQKAYDIEVTSHPTPTRPKPQTIIESEQSVLVSCPAPALQSRDIAIVRVRAYSASDSEPTEWSPASAVETGLLSPDDWSASFITPASHHGPEVPLQPIRFRKEFTIPDHLTQELSKCRLYITALGVYNIYINGHLASDECMAPVWISYQHRLAYRTLDVGQYLNLGPGARNMIAAEVGEGWFAGTLGFRGGTRFNYGCTNGKTIIDFGQNLVGKLHIKSLELPPGTTLTLKHAEVMEHGQLGSRPLNHAKCTDTIISSGKPLRYWTPKFTFHGFRYVQVEVFDADSRPLDAVSLLHLGTGDTNVEALVMLSDMKRRGNFQCSNSLINKLHENVVWSMKGNFLSIPTDCPQRDERLGWTGDIQIFAPTAPFLYGTTGFLSGWLEELAAEQLLEPDRDGVPGLVCPDVRLPGWPKRMPQALWHDATVLVPWSLYTTSNDMNLLEKQFESMRAWLERGIDREGGDGLWNPDRWQFVMVADAYLVHVTSVFAEVCRLLNKLDLADKYDAEMLRLRSTFQDLYITPAGNLMANTQTGIALAICFPLYRSGEKESREVTTAAKALSRLVRAAQFKIGTGFAGTPLITHALTQTAQPQLAYRMLCEKSCPSWMYPATMGATTVWERWNSMLPDGSINPGRMTSFNHYALGAVADWLHGTVGGIAPMASSPGWKVFRVKPIPGGNVTWAETSFDGPYGRIECKWTWMTDTGLFRMSLLVPPKSSALVTLPSELSDDPAQTYNDAQIMGNSVGSGLHTFECHHMAGEWPPKPILMPNMLWQPEDEEWAC
ncbi:alpha-rhamnosidase [Fusarium napiforme]|uniref:alpha-L-rhamnosidase n=1 Tax=Fusarium napiforme TaxID=42672 RepID=A0A8H5K1H1_9HYPO|nr:alpha-rhamnosidase [Fusarium napiforme]